MSVFEGEALTPPQPKQPGDIVSKPKVDKTVPLQGNYNSTILDGQYRNLRTFLADLEGMTVTTQFYHALLGSHDVVDIPDLLGNEYNAQFKYIKNYQVKFQGNMSFNKDSSMGKVSLTGSFNTYPGFVPNKFDLFTMEAGDGSRFLCYLNEVSETDHRMDRSSACQFKVIERMSPEIEQALARRVVETVVFDKRFMSSNPLIKEQTLLQLETIKQQRESLCQQYFDLFYDTATKMFLYKTEYEHMPEALPKVFTGKPFHVVYDELTARAFRTAIPDYGRFSNRPINQVNSGYGDHRGVSLWDMLATRKEHSLRLVFKDALYRQTANMPIDLENNTLALTPITHYLFPISKKNVHLGQQIVFPDRKRLPSDENPAAKDTRQVVYYLSGKYKHVHEKHCYVLSGAFYERDLERCSSLEQLVWRFLDGEVIEPHQILTEIEVVLANGSAHDWYYYFPILLLLINHIFNFVI